jgi:hypothetical protein
MLLDCDSSSRSEIYFHVNGRVIEALLEGAGDKGSLPRKRSEVIDFCSFKNAGLSLSHKWEQVGVGACLHAQAVFHLNRLATRMVCCATVALLFGFLRPGLACFFPHHVEVQAFYLGACPGGFAQKFQAGCDAGILGKAADFDLLAKTFPTAKFDQLCEDGL